jgi:hypothetical protein
MCARTAAIGIGTGLLAFCACALKGHFIPAIGKKPYQRRLLISWILLTLVPILGVVLSGCLLLTMRNNWSVKSRVGAPPTNLRDFVLSQEPSR